MLTLQGKYNTAAVFASIVENEAISQIIELLNQPFTENQRIAIMPDVHAGAGCVIGTTMTITDKVVPNLVGVDIGCGMETVKLKERDVDLKKLDELIRSNIPSGAEVRAHRHAYAKEVKLKDLQCIDHVNLDRAKLSLGSLGGGNHFIEVDKDENNALYLIIHSGSRHLGVETAKFYQNEAYRRLSKPDMSEVKKIVDALKEQGRQSEIEGAIKDYYGSMPVIPKELAYCEGSLFDAYIHDMKIVQHFAELNRKAMVDEIINGMALHIDEQFTTIHNYIDTDNMILRKGSVSAQKGERLLIPINMRDGSLICVGKGNPDYNFSAPHGAGRLMSRSKAKENFTVESYQEEMRGIFTTSVNQATLDECPMAYKPLESIIENLGETVKIVGRIKPVYNFKASDA